MQEFASLLVKVNALDMQMVALIREKKVYPDKIVALEAQVAEVRKQITSTQEKTKTMQGALELCQNDLQLEERKLELSQNRISEIHNSRELEAVQNEIKAHEEKILELQEQLEELQNGLNSWQEQAESNLKDWNQNCGALESELEEVRQNYGEIDAKLVEQKAQAKAMRDQLPSQIHTYYLRLLKSKKEALFYERQEDLVGVINNASTCCPVCKKGLSKTKFQAVRNGNSLITCENCGSILIDGEA